MIAKKNAAATVLVVAVILAMTALSWSGFSRGTVRYLEMADLDTGEIYLRQPLPEDGVFCVSFLHSVNKTNVEEYYQAEGDDIYLIRCRYRSFGAGVATEIAPGQTLRYDDEGYMIIDKIHTLLPELVYKVGTVSDPLIHIGTESWHMNRLAPPLTSVRFTIQR